MGARILVVEDDPAVRSALERALALEGHAVEAVADGPTAIRLRKEGSHDVVLLDVLMPGMDGLEVCRILRGRGDRVPVLMLTAREAVEDRVAGLDAGADDYVVKPFALEELLARIRALLRRADAASVDDVLEVGDLRLDRALREVHRAGRPIELTRTEFLLLEAFMEDPGRVLTRSSIFERVWGFDFGPTSNSLEVYIGYLRRKLEAGGEPRLIHTVRGVGYVLRPA